MKEGRGVKGDSGIAEAASSGWIVFGLSFATSVSVVDGAEASTLESADFVLVASATNDGAPDGVDRGNSNSALNGGTEVGVVVMAVTGDGSAFGDSSVGGYFGTQGVGVSKGIHSQGAGGTGAIESKLAAPGNDSRGDALSVQVAGGLEDLAVESAVNVAFGSSSDRVGNITGNGARRGPTNGGGSHSRPGGKP